MTSKITWYLGAVILHFIQCWRAAFVLWKSKTRSFLAFLLYKLYTQVIARKRNVNNRGRMCDRGGMLSSWRTQRATVSAGVWTGWAVSERNEGKPQRTAGNNGLYCTQQSEWLDGSYSEQMPVFNFLFWKTQQSSTKPIRSNDPDEETNNQQLNSTLAATFLATALFTESIISQITTQMSPSVDLFAFFIILTSKMENYVWLWHIAI